MDILLLVGLILGVVVLLIITTKASRGAAFGLVAWIQLMVAIILIAVAVVHFGWVDTTNV